MKFKCKQIDKILDLFAQKELPGDLYSEISGHIEGCIACREKYESWKAFFEKTGRSVSVPEGFTDRVMSRILAAELHMSKPRIPGLSIFRWEMAGLAAAAVIVLLMFFPKIAERADIKREVSHTFILSGVQAVTVSVVGDFNSWEPEIMEKKDGVWTVTLTLSPGNYQYGYIINGKEWLSDPGADRYADDGFGNKNAIIGI
ncbi:MAG: hypothetical protein JXJ19_05500 [Elusimicrobia bacterium]|nr:hypothetical protein [Elusimicrobiota bacterium]